MSSDNSSAISSSKLPVPSLAARVAFAASSRRIAVAILLIALCYALALSAGAYAGSLADKRLLIGILALVLCVGAVLSVAAVFAPWSARLARPRHIAAALAAATPRERPYLLAHIERRLRNPYWTDPMTLSELTAAFNDIRQEHGTRARRRRLRTARARKAQQHVLTSLTPHRQAEPMDQVQA